MTATVDIESKSYADLTKVGAWAYSEDESTDIICLSYGIDDQPVQTWWPDHACPEFGLHDVEMVSTPEGGSMPKDLYMHILTGGTVECHNIGMEYSMWHNVLTPRYGWIPPYDHSWRDTMAVACYYAMPAALEKLSRALGFPGKDPEGSRLITKYCKLHLKTAKTEIPPDDFEKFLDYCDWDVKLEQSVSDELGPLPKDELEIFLMDLAMNVRGLYLDQEGIAAASRVVKQREKELATEFRKITGGVGHGQLEEIHKWTQAHGVKLDNLQKDYLQDLLDEGDLSNGIVRKAIECRLAISKASTKKLDAMARQVGSDGKARFQMRYHGAVTGRNTGQGLQPLNLTRSYEDYTPEQVVTDIMKGDPELLDLLYGNAMEVVSKASRHWIKAHPGDRIMAGDFTSVEAVVLACLAKEKWKIDAFRKKKPVYELMACKIHGLPEEAEQLALRDKAAFKDKYPEERQDGKTGELAFGYRGALGAWRKFDKSDRHEDEAVIGFCRAWRAENTSIVGYWDDMEEAAFDAVRYKGAFEAGSSGIAFERKDEWLTMILPDGKRLWYRNPRIVSGRPQWHKPEEWEDCAEGSCDCGYVPKLSYMANKNGQWRVEYSYGGKLTENACQAVSRQILNPARKRLAKYGYPEILTVYDEIVCSVPKGHGSIEEFVELMSGPLEEWCADYPISVDAWEGDRYKK